MLGVVERVQYVDDGLEFVHHVLTLGRGGKLVYLQKEGFYPLLPFLDSRKVFLSHVPTGEIQPFRQGSFNLPGIPPVLENLKELLLTVFPVGQVCLSGIGKIPDQLLDDG